MGVGGAVLLELIVIIAVAIPATQAAYQYTMGIALANLAATRLVTTPKTIYDHQLQLHIIRHQLHIIHIIRHLLHITIPALAGPPI